MDGLKLSILLSLKTFLFSPFFCLSGEGFSTFFFMVMWLARLNRLKNFISVENFTLEIYFILTKQMVNQHEKKSQNFPHFRVTFFSFRSRSFSSVATRYIILNPFHAELIDVFPKSSFSLSLTLPLSLSLSPYASATHIFPSSLRNYTL